MHIQPIYAQTPSVLQFEVLASHFEQLHGILYITGNSWASYSYLALVMGGEDYTYIKSNLFNDFIKIVGRDCTF